MTEADVEGVGGGEGEGGGGGGGKMDAGGFSGATLAAISGGQRRGDGAAATDLARMSVREQMAVPNFWWPTLRMVHCVAQPTNSPTLTLEALRAAATCMAEFSDTNRLSLDSSMVLPQQPNFAY